MSENEKNEIELTEALPKQMSYRAGFLPVPLRNVPPKSLAGLDIYLLSDQAYSLYSSVGLRFDDNDCQRLIDSGVEYVYVSVKDHRQYYQTLEKCINDIVTDRRIQVQKKAEMLYSTGLELAHELFEEPPLKEQIDRTNNVAMATVKMIFDDQFAFKHLFEISNHDFYTATHAVNVCTATVALAGSLGMVDKAVLQNIGSGALLHDIGKIFIAGDLLNSSRPITPEEYALLQKHVELGREHLEKVTPDLPPEIIQVVYEHHERLDGSGYPLALKNSQISLIGQLAGIVDTFDAMTSARPYREHTFSLEDVMQHLEDQTPAKFDLDIVRSFNTMIENTIKGLVIDGTDQQKTTAPKPAQTDTQTRLGMQDRRFRIPMMISKIKRENDRFVLEEPLRMIVHNMTCAGLSFLSPRPFDCDQNICISIGSGPKTSSWNLLAVVMRCYDYGDGWYNIAAQFHKTQPAHTIEKLRKIIHPAMKVPVG